MTAPSVPEVTIREIYSNGALFHVEIDNYGEPDTQPDKYLEAEITVINSTSYSGYDRVFNHSDFDVLEQDILVTNDTYIAKTLEIQPNTEYKYGGYATNNNPSDSYSQILTGSFATLPESCEVQLIEGDDTTATFSYSFKKDGGYYAKTLQYSLDNGDTWRTVVTRQSGEAKQGTFKITGLLPSTTYTVITRTHTDYSDLEGEEIEFTTALTPVLEEAFFIKIGELILGGNSQFQLSPAIEGLDSASFRTGDGLYAGRDGGYVAGHFYGHRTITLKGFYIGDDCEDAAQLRKILFSYLRIRYSLPIVINTPYGLYRTDGFVTDIKSDIENLRAGEFQITLLCPDPAIYIADGFGKARWQEYDLTIGDTNVLGNDGDLEAYPIITIIGTVNGVQIVNETTQSTLELNLTTSEPDDEIIVDMNKRFVTLNGTGINAYRTTNSTWWPLVREENDIKIILGEGSSATATIKFKEGISGI